MNKYRQLDGSNLSGQPMYDGLEYDWEVPNNGLIGSPGGTAATFSHYTKGFYGTPSARSDIFAGQGLRYPYGERGNIYEGSPSAYPQNEVQPDQIFMPNNSTPPIIESYKPLPDPVELDIVAPTDKVKITINPWMMMLIFLLAYLAFDMFTNSAELFISQKFHGTDSLTWKQYSLYGVAVLVIMFMIAYFTNVSLLRIESL
jgi:hypothetical protein